MEVVMEEAPRQAASRIQSKKLRIYLMPAEMEGDGVSNRECAFSGSIEPKIRSANSSASDEGELLQKCVITSSDSFTTKNSGRYLFTSHVITRKLGSLKPYDFW